MFFSLLAHSGNVVYSFSAGMTGEKGPRRATPFVAEQAGRSFGTSLRKLKLRSALFHIVSPLTGHTRAAIKGVLLELKARVDIIGFFNKIPRSHNGLRGKKRRRL